MFAPCRALQGQLCSALSPSPRTGRCRPFQCCSWPSGLLSTQGPGTCLKVHTAAARLLTAPGEPCPSCKHGSAWEQMCHLLMSQCLLSAPSLDMM